jgi:hypothetical protein
MPQYGSIDWDQAECRGIYTDLFYSVEEERSNSAYYFIDAVRTTCARCPIWEKCLTYAFNHEDFGVWGGLTSLERASFRDPEKYARQKERAELSLGKFGITIEMLMRVYERASNELGVDSKIAFNREDDFVGDS